MDQTHPKVKRFVVIDDEDDELDQLPLFQPASSTGLTEKVANGVANYLDCKFARNIHNRLPANPR